MGIFADFDDDWDEFWGVGKYANRKTKKKPIKKIQELMDIGN